MEFSEQSEPSSEQRRSKPKSILSSCFTCTFLKLFLLWHDLLNELFYNFELNGIAGGPQLS